MCANVCDNVFHAFVREGRGVVNVCVRVGKNTFLITNTKLCGLDLICERKPEIVVVLVGVDTLSLFSPPDCFSYRI